jgi:hypothetical protein
MKLIGLAAAALALGISSARADFTQGLLARWTFNDTSSEGKALTDDVGGLDLKRGGIGRDQRVQARSRRRGDARRGRLSSPPTRQLRVGEVPAVLRRRVHRLVPDSVSRYFSGEYADVQFRAGKTSLKPAKWAELILAPF